MLNTLNIRDFEEYSWRHTKPIHPVLEEVRRYTQENCDAPQMMVGDLEGKFLQLLISLRGASRVLEIGTFTGYSSICMADAMGPGGHLLSIDINPETSQAAAHFMAKAGLASRAQFLIGSALDILPSVPGPFDLVFIDADKINYDSYYELALTKIRPGGLIVLDNMLWSGRVMDPQSEEDWALHLLNQKIASDSRVDNFLLPLRDGIQIVQKI